MSDLQDLDVRLRGVRLERLEEQGWSHRVNARGWHVLSRLWRGAPQVLGGSDLDAVI